MNPQRPEEESVRQAISNVLTDDFGDEPDYEGDCRVEEVSLVTRVSKMTGLPEEHVRSCIETLVRSGRVTRMPDGITIKDTRQ